MDVTTNKKANRKVRKAKNTVTQSVWAVGYLLTVAFFLGVYFFFRFYVPGLSANLRTLLQRVSLAGCIIAVVFLVTKAVEVLIAKHTPGKKQSYNLIRLVRLLSVLVSVFILITFLFQKWYTAAVSLGLFSLILGFALQTPISSLIGWFYIIARSPYRIGDRIQVGSFKGDVVEISYLDTTLWEFHGDYLSLDVPSGRLIRFPNTLVLQSEVYNYSWKKFPFIWNEIAFHIGYDSDFSYVEKIVRQEAASELGDKIAEQVKYFKDLVKQTPIDDLDIKEFPFVSFKVNSNTWIEVIVTYIVHPKMASGVRTRLIKAIIGTLNKTPEKVRFPKGDAR